MIQLALYQPVLAHPQVSKGLGSHWLWYQDYAMLKPTKIGGQASSE